MADKRVYVSFSFSYLTIAQAELALAKLREVLPGETLNIFFDDVVEESLVEEKAEALFEATTKEMEEYRKKVIDDPKDPSSPSTTDPHPSSPPYGSDMGMDYGVIRTTGDSGLVTFYETGPEDR